MYVGGGGERRPEWTEKLKVREEEHSEEDTGKEVETQRKGKQGKPKEKQNRKLTIFKSK